MSDWRHWTTERGLRAESPPTLRLTTSIFDCFLRQLVPEALRTLALASWADSFERLAPLGDHEGEGLAPRAAEIQKLSPVMADVAAAGNSTRSSCPSCWPLRTWRKCAANAMGCT